ncbi:MAG: carbohydrate ABC transporter permease [Lachnospiraceae bacterium]|nr:carbohydrate ABC transporter permease [Lachnospiraceae bacterium]
MNFRMSLRGKIFLYIFLVLIAIITLTPLIYTAGASLKTNKEIALGGINPFPAKPTFDNFKQVWGMDSIGGKSSVNYADYTRNSVLVSLLTVVLVVVFTSMSAYCFQRGNFPGRDLLYWIFMGTMFVAAGTVTMYPVLQTTTKLKLNNLIGLAIVQFATAGASNLFLTMGYLKTISKDMDDAAVIDGCSFFSVWWRIILPLSRPILATIALMSFRASWNNYLLPNLMLAGTPKFTTLVVAVVQLQSSGGSGATQYNLMMAGTMLAVMPMLILFLVMNKQFVAGITEGAVKG